MRYRHKFVSTAEKRESPSPATPYFSLIRSFSLSNLGLHNILNHCYLRFVRFLYAGVL